MDSVSEWIYLSHKTSQKKKKKINQGYFSYSSVGNLERKKFFVKIQKQVLLFQNKELFRKSSCSLPLVPHKITLNIFGKKSQRKHAKVLILRYLESFEFILKIVQFC